MLVEARQGGLLAPPNDATFWVTYDDVTFRIQSMRCENNNTTRTCRIVFRNALSGQNITRDIPPSTIASYTMKNNEDYFFTDDSWGYTMSLI